MSTDLEFIKDLSTRMNIEMQMAHQTNSNEESIIELFVATLEESCEQLDGRVI